MATNGGEIRFGIGFNVDKSGLNDLKKSLQDIQKATSQDLVGKMGSTEAKKTLDEVKRSASEIERALQKAYNPTINSVNVQRFNQQLAKTGINLNTVYQNFSKVQGGTSTFRNLTTQLLTTNMQLKQTHSLLDSMGQTMMNTVKWGVASSIMNSFSGSIQNAYNYIKVLDSSLTDIRIVTGQSREEMDRFAQSANRAAQNLGRQTKDYTNAALSFYQQGLSDDQVAARTETTLKAANITGAAVGDMANQLTAVWNGFQVNMQNTQDVVSKLAAVADTSASNMSELATAMSKTASVANNMGVDVDQLTAQVATIIATTRQAPQTVGNALKTIYARINDIKAGSDEAQISLGNYTGKMASLGIQVLDQQGHLRDTGQVMEEIGQRWGSMTREQQIYLAQTMAGQRQMNNLIALFDNWDMYTKELNTSLEAQGTLDEKNSRYMESLAAHANQLTAASEGLIQAFADSDSFKGFIDAGTAALKLLTTMVDSIGGGGTALLGFGSILSKVFSKQISNEISSFVFNLQAMRDNAQSLAAQRDLTNVFQGIHLNESLTQQFVDLKTHVLDFGNIVSVEQHNILNELLKQRNELENQKQAWNENKTAAQNFYKAQTGKDIGNLDNSNQSFKRVLYELQNIQKTAHSAAIQMDNLSVSVRKNGFSEDIDSEMQSYINKTEQLIKNNKISADSQNILTQSLEKYKQVLLEAKNAGLSGEELLQNGQIRQAAGELLSNLSNVQTQIQQGAQRTARTVKQAADGTAQKIDQNIEKNKNHVKSFLESIDTKAAVQGFVNLASSIGQIAFAIRSLSNISKTLKDDTLSNSEKTLQVVTALTMALPMLINGATGAAGAINQLGIAFGVLEAGTTASLASIGAVMAAAAPYLIVIGLIAGAIYATVKAYNAQEDAAKKAEKTAEDLKNRYTELKSSYDQLKNSLEDYRSAKKALSELEKGTSEWKDKVTELNQSVLDLIKKYPELAQYVKNVNGQLTISEQGMEKLLETQQKAIQNARLSALSAEIQANEARTVADETQLGRNITYEQNGMEVMAGKTVIDKVIEGINKNGGLLNEQVLDNLGITNQNLRNALLETDNRQQLQDLAKKVKQNTTATEVLTQQYVHSANSNAGIEEYDESQYQDSIDTRVQQQYEKLLPKYQQEYKDKHGFGGYTDEDIQREYVAAHPEIIRSENQLGNKATYYYSDGRVEADIEDSAVRMELASRAAMEEAQKAIPEVAEKLDALAAAGNKIHQNFGDIAATVAKATDETQLVDLSQYSEEELLAIQNSLDSFGQLWEKNGYQHADIYTEVLKNSIKEALSNFSEQVENFQLQVPDISIDNLLESTQKILTNKKLSKDDFQKLQANFSPEIGAQLGDKDSFNDRSASSQLQLLDELFQKQKEYNEISAQGAKKALDAYKETYTQQEREIKKLQDQIQKLNQLKIDPKISAQGKEQIENQIEQLREEIYSISADPYIIDLSMQIDDIGFSDLNTSISETIVNAQRLQSAAELIGQGWQVAAENVGQFASVFPELMTNAEFLENGILQLDQELVAAILGNNVEIINSNKEIAVQAIESKIQQLQAELEFEQNKKAILQSLLNGEITEKGAEKALAQETKAYQGKLEELGVQKNAQATNQVIANAGIGAQGIISYLQSVQNAIATINADYHDMISDKTVGIKSLSASGGGVSANAGWTSGLSADDFGRDSQLDSAAFQEQIQAQIDAADENITRLKDQISSLQGAEANILKQTTQAATKAGYAAGGQGGSYDPSKSKGGGGGGGKDKTKSADEIEKKKLKDKQIDKYHELDRAIKRVEESIKDLDKAQKKTIRNGLSQTIDNQVAALEAQKGLYEQKIGLMQSDLQLQQADLQALGVQFDEQGNIINYTGLMIAYQQAYNALLEEAKLLTGTQQENKLKQAEELKTKLDNLKTQMNAYESLQDQIISAGNSIQDILDKEEQLRIKQFKIKIDWQLDKAQVEKDWNEFRKNVVDGIKQDDFLGQAKARLQDFFAYYKEDGGGIIQELTEHVNKTRREAEIIENGGTSSIYGQNQAQALEDLKHYTDELMQNLEEVEQIAKDIHEYYLDTIDKANDAFEEQIAAYEQIEDIIEHDLNLIQMLKPEANEEQLGRYYELRRENNNQQIDFYRKEADMWKQQMDAAEKGTEEWKKFRDNWMESVSEMNSAIEAAVENLLDKYRNTISKIIRETKDQVLGGDWKKALDEWDRSKWFDDRYLDTASRGNGMLDFIANVNKAMEGASSKQQKDLLKFMNAEVDRLNEMTKVRQIDLDIANKKLEVLQKQYALEEAQENKTQMRLRRDSQGNYTYQYVADENTIQTKQQELRDILEELRLLAKEDLTDTIDTVEEKLEEFFEKAQELSELYYDDTEVLQEKLLELQEEYWGEEGYITMLGIDYNLMQGQLLEATAAQFSELYRQQGEELAAFLGLGGESQNEKSVWGSIKALIGADGGAIPTLLEVFTTQVIPDNFNQISAENQNLLFGPTGLQPSWNTALGDMSYAVGEFALNYGNAGKYIYDVTGQIIIPAIQAMIEATRIYGQDLVTLQQVAGISFSNISQGIDYTIGQTRTLIQDNGTLIDSFQQEMNAVAALNAQIAGLCQQYRAAHDYAIAAARAALTFYAAAQGVAANISLPNYLPGGGGGQVSTGTGEAIRKITGGKETGNNGTRKNSKGSTPSSNPDHVIVTGSNGARYWKDTGEYVGATSNGWDDAAGLSYDQQVNGYSAIPHQTASATSSTYSISNHQLSEARDTAAFGQVNNNNNNDPYGWGTALNNRMNTGNYAVPDNGVTPNQPVYKLQSTGTSTGVQVYGVGVIGASGKTMYEKQQHSVVTSDSDSEELKHIKGYATGGYTGAWANGDSEGRLAFLHQKQLVLNPEDTANMLAAVDIVRGIMNDVSSMNFRMQNGLPEGGAYSAFSRNIDNSTSQNIVINADFPNVSDALEIKQAFNSLVNIASQKANGNRRTY